MDEDRIGLVLAKTAELRSKIVNSIQGNYNAKDDDGEGARNQEESVDEEEEESLLNIKDALESLEGQLASLQDLQQQQYYERESSLSEIESSQKKLLKELKNYKGSKHLQIVREAINFASETDESNNDLLLLPPYPSRPSHSSASSDKKSYLSTLPKLPQNGTAKNGSRNTHEDKNNPRKSSRRAPLKGLVITAAKAAFTVVGVIAVLTMAGFEPRLKRRDKQQFKILDLFSMQESIGNGCPKGKVMVIENGEMRCVVKERVEIPFDAAVDAPPSVSYGCG